ncbi:MAG: arginine--tRNA ligase [Bdellovibrionales bacterium]|nr:arginine--tRNA ligase [Bdellovibrionales bacterium]NQZ18165.1 arginine--tRNA ligase [Bdellovibrionales bacterium]
MSPLFDPFRESVADQVCQHIEKTFQMKLDPKECESDLATVPNPKMGQMAFPCFKLSKELKSNPKEIAEKLAADWNDEGMTAEVRAVGPYLNFFFNEDFFGKMVVSKLHKKEYFTHPGGEKQPYLIEYSQPNTHKELHVGHMRNLCFGYSLILLFRYCGNPTVACTFPGDVGTHVAKCLWYLKYHNQAPIPETNKGQWLGTMYSTAHNKLEDEKGTPQEDENRAQLTEILKQIERKEGEFFELWKETREWSIELMNEVYQWAGVSFEKWYWESDVDSESVKLVKKLYEDGKLIEDKGAIGINLEDEKLGFAMFLKSDGNGLYSTKDLELARRKFEEYNPIENIVVVDMRQELHFKQVFTTFGKLGLGETDRCRHLKYNFVELPDGAMSSRKGNIIPITDLIENMKTMIKDEYLSRYKDEWSQEEIDQTADDVAQGAIKYGMNRMDPNKKIVFDMKEWLRLDGESGPYIQYTHARISSLIRKFQEDVKDQEVDWSLLTHDAEKALMVHLSLFNWSMFKSLEAYKTSGICNYIYDLAKLFNTFYHDCPIGKLEDQKLKAARLALADGVRTALAEGLGLLGVPAPQKM